MKKNFVFFVDKQKFDFDFFRSVKFIYVPLVTMIFRF